MLKLSQVAFKLLKPTTRPLTVLRINSLSSSSSPVAEATRSSGIENTLDDGSGYSSKASKGQRNMVAAAFASLQQETEGVDIATPLVDDKINNANSVENLLALSEGTGISRKYALKVVSKLADWTSSGKVKLGEFENDARFVKLCRILTKGSKPNRTVVSRSEDLSMILNVTADDEAAKLIASITLPQMIKVMTTLSLKKRRSTPLLRSLAFNIAASCDQLDLKQSADVLFSMCSLNFVDDNLLAKVSNDVCSEIGKEVKTSAVVGSIITSVGVLRYKNPEILDLLSSWILENIKQCRPQDVFSLFVTLAILNYIPSQSEQLFKKVVPQLAITEAKKPLVWLNVVWSLVLLNQATPAHLSSILAEEFIRKLEGSKVLTPATKLKLLNINAAANYLVKDYSGPRLSSESIISHVDIGRTREKTQMIDLITSSLKSLIQSENHLQTNWNTGMGFHIDVKCLLDKKCSSLPIDNSNEQRTDVVKIALLAHDYHDMCIGKVDPTGINQFASRLLEAQNYSVISVPYTEFRANDKIVCRVQYLETKLKESIK